MSKNTAIHLKNITKEYPGVVANKNVDFQVNKGEIHALVGENGAGKSTLMKILYGIEQPDEGEILINGEVQVINKVETAINLGIGMVHQEFTLVPSFTAPENIGLGQEPKNSQGLIDWKGLNKLVVDIAEKYGFKVDPSLKMIDASVGVQQRTEILKTLYRNANILILDEPTAVLTPQETDELFTVIRTLVDEGKTVVFITHKLREVMEIADRVTVMRAGEVQGVSETKNTSIAELASQMVGREVFLQVKKDEAKPEEEILNVEDLWVHDARGLLAVKGVSLNIRKGEIVGIAGVEGNGQKEVVEAIIGIQALDSGKVIFLDNDIEEQGTRERLESGISFIPEDRQLQAMIMDMNLTNNVIIGRQNIDKYKSSLGTMKMKNAVNESEKVISSFDVKTPGTSTLATALSGGNQQKFVVGRELEDNPSLLIASQPTRGIDIGAQALIWEKLRNSRDEGLSVLLISADLEELIGLSDRIIVFYQGKLVKELDAEKVTPEDLGGYMTGLKK